MATGGPGIDFRAVLQSFLLNGFVSKIYDRRLSHEERLAARMRLEGFVLVHGPAMLRELQLGFNVSDDALREMLPVLEWFVAFVSSRDATWLGATDLPGVVRFRGLLPSDASRRVATELIQRIEWVADPNGNSAERSRLRELFLAEQPQPFASPRSSSALLIIDTLFRRAKLTPIELLKASPSLGRYGLLVAKFCFTDRFTALTPDQIDSVVALAGELSTPHRDYLNLLLAGIG